MKIAWPASITRDRVRKLPWLYLTPLIIMVIVAIFAPFIAPHSPFTISLPDRLHPPFWQDGGSTEYLLGTDKLGRDILSRMIYGARSSLLIATLSLVMGGVGGGFLGLVSGYFGGRVDAVLMRFADATLSLPTVLLALVFAVALGPNTTNIVIALSIVLWARYARVVRGEVLTVKEREYVTHARIVGASSLRIMLRHITPNIMNTWVVLLTLQVGWVILVEASLSFLGAGVPPPTPAWGSMVADGREYITSAWWLATFPGLAIMLIVLCFNMLGDWLRDKLDPKLRQV